jgi:hypothetical protein
VGGPTAKVGQPPARPPTRPKNGGLGRVSSLAAGRNYVAHFSAGACQDGPALSLARWNQRPNKERAPAAGGRGKVVGVTGVTVTDGMLMDAGFSRQHRDSRNSIAETFLQNQISDIILDASS